MDPFMVLQSLLIYAVYFILSYVLLEFFRRVWLHPLKSYPGPILAKITDLYALRFAATTNLHHQTFLDHQRYGPVLRQGPNKIIFNSSRALHDIHNNSRVTKSGVYLASLKRPDAFNLFNAIDYDLHRVKRQLVAPVVSDRSLRIFETTMTEQVDIFIQSLRKCCQSDPQTAIDMTARCKWLGMDVVGLLAFGYPLQLQTQEHNRFIIDVLRRSNYILNLNMQQPLLTYLHLELLLFLQAIFRGKSYLGTIETMIKERMSQDKHAQHDFYSFVADGMETTKDNKVKGSEIWAEAIFFLSAGGDTVSTALSALFFYLSRNQDCYQQLASEIRSNFKSPSEIRSPRLAKCHYLRACIDETLRMSPPLPGTLWREQAVDGSGMAEPLVIDGHVVPPGTQVGVNVYALHHNETYFPEPFRFRPERWLPEHAALADKKAFAPFLVGPRSCAGKAMAYLEASLVLAKTLWYFDFEPASGDLGRIGGGGQPGADKTKGSDVEYLLHDIVVSSHRGPYLQFRCRDDSNNK